MTVLIYPSKLDGEPIERHQTDAPLTLEAWLRAKVPSFEPRVAPPISIYVNGEYVTPAQWGAVEFGPRDTVSIYPEPKGAELIIAAVTLAAAVTLVTSLLIPKIPKPKDQGSTQGDDIGEAVAKGNKIKINSPIRELAGRHQVYPDYLLPPHRYFLNQREQWVDLLLCVGVGEFDLPLSRVRIGDTPILSLGDSAVVNIYEPGESLAADQAAVWWHSAPEVAPTSTGSAGLDLRTTSTAPLFADYQTATFDGDEITIPAGAGSFPAEWAPGMIVRIEVPYAYTVFDGTGTGGRDVINGDITQLALPDGAAIEIVGDNEGLYRVFDSTGVDLELDFDDFSPATGLTPGAAQMTIGYRGLRYRILSVTAQVLQVERLTDTGATDGAWPGFSLLNSTTSTVRLDETTGEINWSGPFLACPAGEETDTIEVDFLFVQGLFGLNKKGGVVPTGVTVEVQYRDITTAGAWTSHLFNYNAASIDQIGFTETITLSTTMRPEVRCRRVNPDLGSAQISDAVQWYGLRALLDAPTVYAGVTTLTLRIRGGDRISTQSEQLIAVEPTRKLPIRSGGAEAGVSATRSIAPWVRHVAKSVGYSDADLDLVELDRLGDLWDARGDFFDMPVDGRSTVKAVLSDALGAGFADVTIDRGRIRPVRDEPRTVYEHMYTPQNMAEGLQRQFKAVTPDDFDGVNVEYVDTDTWNVETVEARLPGDIGARVETIRANGVTDRDKAWRIGMRQRRSHKYRRWQYTWGTELDALNSRYLSFVAVADDVPGYGQSAIMTAISGDLLTITSSEKFTWAPAATHVVAVRRPDGSLSGPYTATRVNDSKFTVSPVLDFTPDLSGTIEPPHLLFGTSTRWSFPTLVTEIVPNGAESVGVTGVNYDVRVYADDDGTAPS